MNDEEVIQASWFQKFRDVTWDILVSRGSDKNYGSREAFLASQQKSVDDVLRSHKHSVEIRLPSYIKDQKKDVLKIEGKIADLLKVI